MKFVPQVLCERFGRGIGASAAWSGVDALVGDGSKQDKDGEITRGHLERLGSSIEPGG